MFAGNPLLRVAGMPHLDYPDALKKSFWDKKKGALDGAAEVLELLKALQKKHEAIDWPKLADGWTRGVADADKLSAVYQPIDKLYRTKVAPLRLEAAQLAMAADKAGKAKDASKPMREAVALISKTATQYARSVAAGLDALEAEFVQASHALKKAAASQKDSDAEGDDEPASALLDPKRLLKQLNLCKADTKRQLNFAYLDDGQADPLLAVHPRITGRPLMARLVKDTGIKKGSFGLLSLDGNLLRLVVEKKLSGLVKRIRIPIRASGFRLGKVTLVDESGQVLDEGDDDERVEQEGEEATADTTPATKATPAARPGNLDASLQQWAQARQAAITTLKDVARTIADMKDPESAQAVLQISAVVKNLTAEPRTPAQVAELARYLNGDDVVLDVSELANDIRTPLLKALSQLHKAVAAG